MGCFSMCQDSLNEPHHNEGVITTILCTASSTFMLREHDYLLTNGTHPSCIDTAVQHPRASFLDHCPSPWHQDLVCFKTAVWVCFWHFYLSQEQPGIGRTKWLAFHILPPKQGHHQVVSLVFVTPPHPRCNRCHRSHTFHCRDHRLLHGFQRVSARPPNCVNCR